MIIGIDGNEANVDRKVGISEYSFELIKQFKDSASSHSFQIYLKNLPNTDMPVKTGSFTYKVFGPKKLWTQIALPFKLFTEKDKPDIFFSPGHYAPRFSPIPSVISIMDLAFFHFPEYFTKKDLQQLHSWTRYSVKKARAIITISQASKNDIINLYDVPKERVHVVYPGIKDKPSLSPHVYPMKELQTQYSISGNFVLFVGTLQPRKNIVRLIEAFSILKKKKKVAEDLELVIIGKKGWNYEEILQAPEKYQVSDSVKFLDFVSDDHLALFYKNALCFAWPSLYEGFGLPVLEAMSYNCPVITSNVSSLPEAGGDAAIYVDPKSTEDIAEKIEKVVSSKKLREEMIEKGKKHIKNFSWEKSAKETLAILEDIGNNK